MPQEPTLALDELVRRIGGDQEFAVELLNDWVATLSSEISGLRTAIEKKDAEGLRHQAHSLKGSAANMAAREFSRLAGICEEAGRNASFAEAEAALPLLADEAETLQAIIPGIS